MTEDHPTEQKARAFELLREYREEYPGKPITKATIFAKLHEAQAQRGPGSGGEPA